MVIIKNAIRNMLIFVVILVLIAIIIISYTTYSKSKETQAFYTSTYNKAFGQTEITSGIIENVLENKSNITGQEILSQLNDIHNSLDMTAKDFNLISSRLSSNKPNTNYSFMPDLFQLYSDEITRLQSELIKNNLKDKFDQTKDVLFIRLALMNADLRRILALDNQQLENRTYDQAKQIWVKVVNTLEYKEVSKVYKLKHSYLFVRGYFFPYKKN